MSLLCLKCLTNSNSGLKYSFEIISIIKDIVERLIKKEVKPVVNKSSFIQQNNVL